MYQKIDYCPLCGSNDFKNYIIAKDYLITQESFAISKCKSCSFLFTNPRPDNNSLKKYYQSQEYDSHKIGITSIKDILYRYARKLNAQNKLAIISKVAKGNTLLDIGSGQGHFVNYCYNKEWQAQGVEPNLPSTYINSFVKIHSSLSTITDSQFSVITMWHSLEHIPELDFTLTQIKKLLAKDGVLVVAVPNINSLDAQLYKEHWAGLDVPRHLYHFTQDSMARLLKNHGLKVHGIEPLKFDAYYVSLLSEKYKTGKMNYINAFKNGKKSNDWAKENSKDYSSLIYLVKKK